MGNEMNSEIQHFKVQPITLTIEQAGHVFNQQRDYPQIGDLTGLVWVDHFETWLVFNRGLICVDRFSA